MMRINSKRKSMVLMFCLYFVIILAGLSSAAFIRVMNESRAYSRERDRIIAFYNAEAGLAYAYAELSKQNFSWYTVDENGDPLDPETTISDSRVIDGIYKVPGQSFEAKSYREYRDSQPTGIIILRSRGTSNNITRTLEYRIAQESAYKYFFFFPSDMTFGGEATYNGRNYGGIHVNGNIIFSGNLYLKYLTELTCSGYMRRYSVDTDLHDISGNGPRPNLSGIVNYVTTISDVTNINNGTSESLFWGSGYHLFDNSSVYFWSGAFNPAATGTSGWNAKLQYLSGSGAAWQFDEYAGTSTSTFSYNIGEEDLKNLAIREVLTGSDSYSSGYKGLLDAAGTIPLTITDTDGSVSTTSYSERAAFQKAYEEEQAGKTVDWSAFWSAWKNNHTNDYQTYAAGGLIDDDGLDWQRRFFQSAYNWADLIYESSASTAITYRNLEWLKNMTYGDNRADSDENTYASVPYTSEELAYYLNTEYQGDSGTSSVWGQYLVDNNFDEEGEDLTYIADKTQGGKYVSTGDILNSYTDTNALKEKAKNGGIYIGYQWPNAQADASDINNDGKIDLIDFSIFGSYYGCNSESCPDGFEGDFNNDGEVGLVDLSIIGTYYNTSADFVNPIEDCTEVSSFYNSQNPGRENMGTPYEASAVLKIDVNALKNKIESEGSTIASFNGIIYVDLPRTQDWSGTGRTDYRADGVMLTNGEVLPEGGLSLVTNNNVYLKGNFNLDATGDTEKNRTADSTTVLNNAIDAKDYLSGISDFDWQPAEIITSRYIYTLSDDFPEPAYMPMASSYSSEYAEENTNNTVTYDFVNSKSYPTDSWVPAAGTIIDGNAILSKWFEHYYTGEEDDMTKFDSSWVSTNWSDPNQVFAMDSNGDGINEYILANDLISAVTGAIGTAYTAEFSYNPAKISMANSVSKPYIYNTAIVSPYSVGTYALEKWSSPLTINGAFIQLPAANGATVPPVASSSRHANPTRTFNYESRYGKNSSASDRPNTGLTFGADSSWREVGTF